MRRPPPRFDPRRHQVDRIDRRMCRKCDKIIGLCQTFEIAASRKNDRHLTPIGHCERRSEEHTSELQSLMRISYAVFCLKKKKTSENKYTQLEYINCNRTTLMK